MGQSHSLEIRLTIIEKQLKERSEREEQLKREIETLRNINTDLESKLKAVNNTTPPQLVRVINGDESQPENVDIFISKLLEDPDVNIPYLPDYVEKQIYRNVFTKIYGLLDQVLSKTFINLPGNKKIKFNLI